MHGDAGSLAASGDERTTYNVAFDSLKAGKYELALADYDAALAINPRLASSLYGRGLAKQRKGDPGGGRIDFAAARAIDPKIVQNFGK